MDLTTPTWNQVHDLTKQVGELKQLLYFTKVWNMEDGSPCWCIEYEDSETHSPICIKARKATEPFWKK